MGKFPCELVKKYGKSLKTLNQYYWEWKVSRRKRAAFIPQIVNRLEMLGEERKEWRRNYNAILRRIEAKPMEWWFRKETAMDALNAATI